MKAGPETRLKPREERCHLVTPEPLSRDDGAAFVDAVNLEHVLGQIQTDGRDPHELPPSSKRARSPAVTLAAGGRAKKWEASIPLTLVPIVASTERVPVHSALHRKH